MLTYQSMFEIGGMALFVAWVFTQHDRLYYSLWMLLIVFLLCKILNEIHDKPFVNVYIDKDSTKIEIEDETENHNTRSN